MNGFSSTELIQLREIELRFAYSTGNTTIQPIFLNKSVHHLSHFLCSERDTINFSQWENVRDQYLSMFYACALPPIR